MIPGPGEVVRSIVGQIQAQLPPAIRARFVFDEAREGWVRVVLDTQARAMDVVYRPVPDVYDVEVYTWPLGNPAGDHETERVQGVYCDDLGELLARPRRGSNRPLFEPRTFEPEVYVTDWRET